MKTHRASFKFSAEAHVLLENLADHYGLSKTAVIELLVRKEARAIQHENVQVQVVPIEKK